MLYGLFEKKSEQNMLNIAFHFEMEFKYLFLLP